MSTIREDLEAREREFLALQAAKSADSKGRRRPEPEDPDSSRLPARSRPCHSLEGVPPAEAQDTGVSRADRRPLPHTAHAHARGLPDRPQHRQGAAAARGVDRSHCARPRPGPSAVWPRGRTGHRQARPGRLQSLRAEPSDRGRARERPAGAESDLGSARRHRAPLEGQARPSGRRAQTANARARSRGRSRASPTSSPMSITTSTMPSAPAFWQRTRCPGSAIAVLGRTSSQRINAMVTDACTGRSTRRSARFG